MIDEYVRIEIPHAGLLAWTMSGHLKTHSTGQRAQLHTHAYHQVLTIQNGVSLLADQTRKQPLFGYVTALIPADVAHRSTVTGDSVSHKSLYLSPEIFSTDMSEIVIFTMSALGAALFKRILIGEAADLGPGLNRECLDLLLKILSEDIARPAHLVRLPQPTQPQNQRVIQFIEGNYARRLAMPDFVAAFPYSERHLSRLFKADLKIGILDYLRLYRMLIVSIQLSTSSRTITEIAFDSGYESISSFYRDFNLTFALSPKAFRDRINKHNVTE
jgi:AraC-like DNA-binding protein